MKRAWLLAAAGIVVGLGVVASPGTAADQKDDAAAGWVSMFNGKDLSGWKASDENPGSFQVVDGELVVKGPRGHLFYAGDDGKASFTNFEFHAKVMTKPKANSGIYFHTEWQKDGWPSKGYECQVNQTHGDRKKTGGLYAIKDVMDQSPAKDGEWYDYDIRVQGKHIVIKINGEVTCDWTEPEGWQPPQGMAGRRLSSGTFAIQAHDPGSVIHYKDIRVKRLGD